MTNSKLFREKVESLGITYTYLAEKTGITRESLYGKVQNKTEFKASEILNISKVLQLEQKEINDIFFNQGVN